MAQQMRVLATLPEDLSLTPSTHIAVLQPFHTPLWAPDTYMVYKHKCMFHLYIKQINKLKMEKSTEDSEKGS